MSDHDEFASGINLTPTRPDRLVEPSHHPSFAGADLDHPRPSVAKDF